MASVAESASHVPVGHTTANSERQDFAKSRNRQ